MVSGVSILNFSVLRKGFRLLKSRIGLHLLLGLGTRNNRLKNPREVCLFTSSIAFFAVS